MSTRNKSKVLGYYFGLTYISLLINLAGYLKTIKFTDFKTTIFVASVFVSYCLLYLLITFLPIHIIDRILSITGVENLFCKIRINTSAVIYTFSVAFFFILHVFIFADKFIYSMYDFHINGFVWNIVFSPGGLDSLGAGSHAKLTFALTIVSFLLLQVILMVLSKYLAQKRFSVMSRIAPATLISVTIFFALAGSFQALVYGVSSFQGYIPVLAASKAFPLYQPVTFRGLAKSMGLKANEDTSFKMKVGESFSLKYPLNPILRDPNHSRYNIICLVAESLRGDMLDPEIMPATWNFANRSIRCSEHYSSGNGTRMGLFGMFYGLYGNYWFSFLQERKSPLLMDMLIEDNYQFSMYTSASFTYPEFCKTLFSSISPQDLHPYACDQGWKSDCKNVSDLLGFIDKRDVSRPFMTFMFFESPHSRYYFPPENVIRSNYLDEFNYATTDIAKDIGLIKNRYINSCNHLDSQISRIIEYLKDNELFDSTIVLITGDHGEEFMEKGRWGHNSKFNEEQTITPMVLWVPGCEPQTITSITSHLDIAPTLMTLIGVTNTPSDYCLGNDLLGKKIRDFTVISDWDSLAYVDSQFKAVFPLKVYGFANQNVTTHNDAYVADSEHFYNTRRDKLLKILMQAGQFTY